MPVKIQFAFTNQFEIVFSISKNVMFPGFIPFVFKCCDDMFIILPIEMRYILTIENCFE